MTLNKEKIGTFDCVRCNRIFVVSEFVIDGHYCILELYFSAKLLKFVSLSQIFLEPGSKDPPKNFWEGGAKAGGKGMGWHGARERGNGTQQGLGRRVKGKCRGQGHALKTEAATCLVPDRWYL